MKKIIIITLLLIFPLMSGCGKENKIMKCTLENGENTIDVIIKQEEGNVIVQKKDSHLECLNEICSESGNEEEIVEEDNFDSIVKKYKKDGFNCEE